MLMTDRIPTSFPGPFPKSGKDPGNEVDFLVEDGAKSERKEREGEGRERRSPSH